VSGKSEEITDGCKVLLDQPAQLIPRSGLRRLNM
jgi:hypothetical protein